MRILMLHNRYKIRGGEDESTASEIEMLLNAGHEVDYLEATNDDILSPVDRIGATFSTVWNHGWYRRVRARLTNSQFDVVHVQNFFPLISPAVYYAADSLGLPVLQAVRNYRLVCPSHNLFRDGRLCRDCVGTMFKTAGVRHRCYRKSLVGTSAIAMMSALHRVLGTWDRQVHRFIAISNYVADALIEDGFPRERIVVKPNFVHVEQLQPVLPVNERTHLLFVGRLTPEKGVGDLVQAYRDAALTVPLYIVGEGEFLGELPQGVHLLGRKSSHESYRLMRTAACVVMPGRWPEPFGRVAVEAFAQGTPVITTDLGGTSEIVTDRTDGRIYRHGSVDELRRVLLEFFGDDRDRQQMACNARASYLAKFTRETNLDHLMRIYEDAIRTKRQHPPTWKHATAQR